MDCWQRTPLFDALGRGINDLAHFLANVPAQDQPAKVIMVVVTDGRENSSREFNKPQVEKMIAEKTERDGWQFVFWSADLSAMHEAIHTGIRSDKALIFQKNRNGSKDAWIHSTHKPENFGVKAGKCLHSIRTTASTRRTPTRSKAKAFTTHELLSPVAERATRRRKARVVCTDHEVMRSKRFRMPGRLHCLPSQALVAARQALINPSISPPDRKRTPCKAVRPFRETYRVSDHRPKGSVSLHLSVTRHHLGCSYNLVARKSRHNLLACWS